MFVHMPLPYDKSALQPVISARAVELHHKKHHKGYVDKLNKLVENTPYASLPLQEVIRNTASGESTRVIFNNAGQVWNHDFFWRSMSPDGGGRPGGQLQSRIQNDFGSFEQFTELFVETAVAHFGSGWAWLCGASDGGLKVIATHDAESPMLNGLRALLCCDLWEHAYYLDYQNDREGFVRAFLSRLANWTYAAEQGTRTVAAE